MVTFKFKLCSKLQLIQQLNMQMFTNNIRFKRVERYCGQAAVCGEIYQERKQSYSLAQPGPLV